MSEEQGNATPEVVETAPVADVAEENTVEGQPEAEVTPQEAKKQEAEIKKALKSYEVKVNGKSKTIDLDMDNDEEVKKYIQKAMASDERFQEASNYKKQAEQLVDMLQKDPLSILRNPALGLDIRKLAEQVLLQDLEEQQKSPEQKKLEDYERRLKEYEDNKKKDEDERRAQQIEAATARNQQEIENSMMQALEKSDFPAEPFFIRRVADAMASAIENGWEDVTVEDIMPYVEGRMKSDFGSLIGKHKEPAKLEKLLGKDVLNEYRKHSVAKVKAAPSTAAKSTVKPEEPKEVKPRRIRIDDIGGW
jgi:hypothetical protein